MMKSVVHREEKVLTKPIRPARLRPYAVLILSALGVCGISRIATAHPGLHHDIERVTRELAVAPNRVDLMVKRGRLYRLDGQYEASLGDLDRAVNQCVDPKPRGCPDAYLQRGLTLFESKCDAAALADLSLVIQSNAHSPRALAVRARIHARGGRLAEAITDGNQALRLRPDLELYLLRASWQAADDRLSDAALGLREGLKTLGRAVQLEDALVDVELRRGHLDDALTILQAQIDRQPSLIAPRIRRAEVLRSGGRAQEADKALTETLDRADALLERRPTAINLTARARVLLALNRRDAAASDLRRAIALAPGYHSPRQLLYSMERGAEIERPVNSNKEDGVANCDGGDREGQHPASDTEAAPANDPPDTIEDNP